ncbi:MAG TPA: GNAT family N-acetyltransferase [Terracidiphilus sp.]|jgi:GNAT superfamily N-acetyltransferase
MATPDVKQVVTRRATTEDGAICGDICYRAFTAINREHNFPPDFPHAGIAIGFLTMLFGSPGFYCVVAEMDGRVVGSNAMDERSRIMGIGPVTVDPEIQNAGVGRELMRVAMDRAQQRGAAGVRLVQAAFHNRSLSLYTKLGFDVREPLSCVQGQPLRQSVPGYEVRPAEPGDLEGCNEVAREVHGFARSGELEAGMQSGTARVVERVGRITGYTSDLGFFGHTVTESNADLQALIASADAFSGPGILVPSRNTSLLRWCLSNGLRVTQPMTLMSMGLYNEPAGAWLPSVLF